MLPSAGIQPPTDGRGSVAPPSRLCWGARRGAAVVEGQRSDPPWMSVCVCECRLLLGSVLLGSKWRGVCGSLEAASCTVEHASRDSAYLSRVGRPLRSHCCNSVPPWDCYWIAIRRQGCASEASVPDS